MAPTTSTSTAIERARDRAVVPLRRGVRLLVVDDSPVMCDVLTTLFTREPGIGEVAVACDGDEAVRMGDQLRPDGVLMDLRMPGITGIDATRDITNAWPRTRVVIHTAYDSDSLLEHARTAGAASWVRKGAPVRELVDSVLSRSTAVHTTARAA
jgi:DNA-binding NarL/FixJ family response regulator